MITSHLRRVPDQITPSFECSLREIEVLRGLMVDGADNRTVGRRVHVGEETIKTHMRRIYHKTGMPSRTALVLALARGDLVIRDPAGTVVKF